MHVTICITTCGRPDGLVRLLESVGGLQHPDAVSALEVLVVDNHPVIPVRKLLAFRLDPNGIPTGEKKEFYDFGKGRGGDGMCIDEQDNIYVTAGANRLYPNQNTDNPAGVYVFSSEGKMLGIIPIPEDMVTNCCFGGPELKTLYITGGKTLWKIPCKVPGRLAWPSAVK